MKKILAMVLTMAMLLAAAGAMAQSLYESGKQLYDQGDYEAALVLWEQAAESGDTEAMVRLGECYELGRGVPEDAVQAEEWYQKAKEQDFN